jgi:hypothetical protein
MMGQFSMLIESTDDQPGTGFLELFLHLEKLVHYRVIDQTRCRQIDNNSRFALHPRQFFPQRDPCAEHG